MITAKFVLLYFNDAYRNIYFIWLKENKRQPKLEGKE